MTARGALTGGACSRGYDSRGLRVKRLGTENGATATEFAIVALLLAFLLFGILLFGRFLWLREAVTSAAREGARYGIATGQVAGVERYRDCDGIIAAARALTPDLAAATTVTVSYQRDGLGEIANCPGSPPAAGDIEAGDRLIVSVSTPMDLDFPVVGSVLPSTVDATQERSIFLSETP